MSETSKKMTTTFHFDKHTKGTTRFASDNEAVPTIYIRKPFFQQSKNLRITIEEVEDEG